MQIQQEIELETANIAQALKDGGVGIVPTDTNYGLAVDPFNEEACTKLYEIKNRDSKKPLTLLIAKPNDVLKYADLSKLDKDLLLNLVN